MTLRFDEGTFTQFYRLIPSRRTDRIEIVSASIDGWTLPRGEGEGQVQVSGSSQVRVTWRFGPVSNTTHTFVLTYIARGTVRREADADGLAWRVRPTEHAYRIASSATDILLPAPVPAPRIDTHRVGRSTVAVDGTHVRIDAAAIGANGWLEAWVRLPSRSVIDDAPAWQQREADVRRDATVWVIVAVLVLLCGLAVLFGVRQRYESPPRNDAPAATSTVPPDRLSPVLAGALVANGSAGLAQAMAALFELAERGELAIEEQPRRFGQRLFAVRQPRPAGPWPLTRNGCSRSSCRAVAGLPSRSAS